MKVIDFLSLNNSILAGSVIVGFAILNLSSSVETLSRSQMLDGQLTVLEEVPYINAIKVDNVDSEQAESYARFTMKFTKKFPTLKDALISATDSGMLWAVTYNNSTIYFTSDLKVAINGSLSHIPQVGRGKNKLLPNNLGGITSTDIAEHGPIKGSASSYSENINSNNSVPIPPNRHTGVVRPAYAEGVATVDRSLLPYFKATNRRDDHNPKYIITFVDTTCPACKRFITKIPELNELGIDVYLAPFARGGSDSSVAKVMTSAWCSEDNDTRIKNVLKALSGRLIPADCQLDQYKNNIERSFHFGEKFLNKTTPVSFTQNGIIVIANLDTQGFIDAFTFGDALADFVVETSNNPS
jgi:hypothetical protein